ncbi:MAG: dihydrolipoyl dehydrogenase [Dehalococcoidia bacterium]|nr:dihydrolipoyl dehydrogenase [Dehalococcoidia bacterium]
MTAPPSAFDVVIIGGGPGGYVAAIRGAQLGLTVALVERESVGGTCLNWGCIPAKALLRGADIVALVRDAAVYGVDAEVRSVALGPNVDHSREVVGQVVRGVESLLAQHGVHVIREAARLLDAHSVGAGGATLRAEHIVIATGARPRSLPGIAIDGVRILDSRAALALRETPRSVVIVGGGCVGVEFAYLYRAYGADVTLVEHGTHLLGEMDEDITTRLEESLRNAGVEVVTGARVEALTTHEQGVRAVVSREGATRDVHAERALVAVGITPNTDGLGLEAAGIRLDERGFVAVDERLETSEPGLYAIGDVTGVVPLAHVASAQGIVAIEALAGLEPAPLDYDWMPRAVYCTPQVGSIGLTEAAARARGHRVRVGRVPYATNGKAAVLGAREGLAKLVADGDSGAILGFHVLGEGATELLAEVGVAHTLESTVLEIAQTVHAHPTLSELVRECALAATGEAIHFFQPRH